MTCFEKSEWLKDNRFQCINLFPIKSSEKKPQPNLKAKMFFHQLSLELPNSFNRYDCRVARLKRQMFLLYMYFCFMRKPICQYTALSKDVTSHIEIRQKSNEYQLVKDVWTLHVYKSSISKIDWMIILLETFYVQKFVFVSKMWHEGILIASSKNLIKVC